MLMFRMFTTQQIEGMKSKNMMTINRSVDVQAQIDASLASKGKEYKPRTEHFNSDKSPSYTNRLILEASPYLLQHSHNPVDWHAWGPEAFVKANKEDKPIFLSIGYSTCHWCHVMEKESFENLDIAKFLNENFVSIKVDRECRPDIDATYMTAVQLISGHGGWPMSSFLTAEGKTFFGGTYYPPEKFLQLLRQIYSYWLRAKPEIIKQANQFSRAVSKISSTHLQAQKIDADIIKDAVMEIMAGYDQVDGGFSLAPKFPGETSLYLLLEYVKRHENKTLLSAINHTLNAMACGGIHDQIGNGFHRYSTDTKWLIPHFEKMLYNQANLSRVYLKAWQQTADPEYALIVRKTLEYVLREMTAKDGGFFSAADADTEGEEGLYFIWTPQEIKKILKPSDAQLAIDIYRVTEKGNFEGSNILYLSKSIEDYAKEKDLSVHELKDRLNLINQQLLRQRQTRIAPLRDDKIITAWNGMMITAFAQAGDILEESRYLSVAKLAAQFIWEHNYINKGELLRVNLNNRASIVAKQDDYAYLSESFLSLFDITGEKVWLDRAIEITDLMIKLFWDKKNGGFFMGLEETSTMGMGRAKDGHDGAIPSGNSVALHVLQKLSRRTNNLDYEKYAQQLLSSFSAKIQNYPSAFAYLLSAAGDMFLGEISAHQFAAKAAVMVDAIMSGTKLIVNISIRSGWHINSNQPLQDSLFKTDLFLSQGQDNWTLGQVHYPEAKVVSNGSGSKEESLAIYEGQITLTATVESLHESKKLRKGAPIIELMLQACGQNLCFPPETLKLFPLKR